MDERLNEMDYVLSSYVSDDAGYRRDYTKYIESKKELDAWYAGELDTIDVGSDLYTESRDKLRRAIYDAEGRLESNKSRLDDLIDENANYLDALRERFEGEYAKGVWSSSKYVVYNGLDEAFLVRDRTYEKILLELDGKEELSNKLSGLVLKWLKGFYNILFGKDAGVSKLGGSLILVGLLITLYRLMFGRGNTLYKLLLLGVLSFILYRVVSPKKLLDNNLVLTCYSSIDYIDKELKKEKIKVEKYYNKKIGDIKLRSKDRLAGIEKNTEELKSRKQVYLEYEYGRRLEELRDALLAKYSDREYKDLTFDGLSTSKLGYIETFSGFRLYPKYDLKSLQLVDCSGDKLTECVGDIISYKPGSEMYLVDLSSVGKSYTKLYSDIGVGFDRVRDELVVTEADFIRMHNRVVRRSSQVLRDKSLGLDIGGYSSTYIIYTGDIESKYTDMIYELNSLEEAGVYCIYRNVDIGIDGVSEYNCKLGKYVSYKGYEFKGGNS